MNDEAGEEAPTRPEALVRVQPISDPKAFKRHLLRTFDQGQPRYAYADELDADAWKLWPEMVPDFVEAWQPIDTEGRGPKRSVIALALTFSMPAGTDPAVNEAAVLAMARKVFAGPVASRLRRLLAAVGIWSSVRPGTPTRHVSDQPTANSELHMGTIPSAPRQG